MSTTKKTLAIIGGLIIVVAVTVFSTVTVQVWQKQKATEQVPPVAEAPPAPPPAPPAPVLAQVTAVNPHYIVTSKPVKKCQPVQHTEYTQPQQKVPVAGGLLGGVAGGLAGSAVHGKNRDLAIGAGAVVGAVTGAAVQNSMNQPQAQTVESLHCETHNVATKTRKGYEVTYLYNGQSSTVLMDKAPAVGDMIPPPGQPAATTTSSTSTSAPTTSTTTSTTNAAPTSSQP
jgi:uncharacterized protein YcfJ